MWEYGHWIWPRVSNRFQSKSPQLDPQVKDDSGQMKVATFKPGRLIVQNYQACTSVRCRENESSRDGHVYHNTMF